jgi:hypothetical protein
MRIKSAVLAIAAMLAVATPSFAQYQNAITQSRGVSLFNSTPATATATSAVAKLPTFSGYGTLTITGAGITGSPSGCTITLAYQGNNSTTAGATVATISFTPSTGVQTFNVVPSVPTGDNYVATLGGCSPYPTAGTITASFSPLTVVVAANLSGTSDPCQNSGILKSSAAVSITTATTTQLVALSAGKSVYVCGFTASLGLSDSIVFEYGTGSACGTGTTALTGAFTSDAAVIAAPATLGGEGTRMTAPSGNALCALTTGTGGIKGVVQYVQQ